MISAFNFSSPIRLLFSALLLTGVGAASTSAADLGQSCCSDLEERVAELEDATARKGNRKVTLTVSGYVAQELTWWDDGIERNAYLHGLGPTQATHFKLGGQARIAPGWTAGYLMRIQNLDDDPFSRNGATGDAISQDSARFAQGLNVQMSFWYLDSKDLGKLSVGKLAHAGKSAAMFTDQSGTQIFDNYTFLSGFPQFAIRSGGGPGPAGLTWGQLAFCYSQALPLGGDCNGIVMNGVRYDAPTIGGFTLSASWGEDDFWEVAARYSGEARGFRVLIGAGYSQFSDERVSGPSVSAEKNSNFVQAGGYVEHLATGLFVHAAYGHEDNNATVLTNGRIAPDSHHWYVKSGIRRKWTALGATVIYGDYTEYKDQLGPAALALGATSSTFSRYGGGIAQEIDAAAMTLYLKAQHYEAEVSGVPAATDLDGLDLISAGALINF